MRSLLNTIGLLLPLVVAVGACSLAPTYRIPSTAPPTGEYNEQGDWRPAQPLDDQSRGSWWTIFHDPQLDALELKVKTSNQDLKAAFARWQGARAATRIARSGLFPTVNAAASAGRARVSQNVAGYVHGEEPTFNDFDVQADLSYEIDLWGRVRNTVTAAKANQQGSAADFVSAELTVRAELAKDYFTLRSQDAEQALLARTVLDYTNALELTERLYNGGAAAQTDVDQAQAQLETARTQAAEIALARSQTEHAIALLVGENPTGFHIAALPLTPDTVPPPVDPGLPSTLLERRPDVAAAERRVAAANAEIGVARAAYFPVFNLAAAIGFDSQNTSTWLNAPSRAWSAGASGLLTVFDAGRHKAESSQAHAHYDEQVANYRNTVLTAYQEVEDSLAALRRLEEESVSEAAAVTATGRALEQAEYRYKSGLVTYLEVSTTETTALQAQLTQLSILNRRMSASVLLIRALGGGWHATRGEESLAQRDTSPALGGLPVERGARN
jgi:NodT family efflux transporter outer membrane factor (OMF) lipoprotein